MVQKLIAEKHVVIKFKDQNLLVDELPEHIKNEIATLDKMRQDKLDITYNLDVIESALQFKMLYINKLLQDHFSHPVHETVTQENNENDTK